MSTRTRAGRPLPRALRATDRWFRALGLVTIALLVATGGLLVLGHEAWRAVFTLAHLAALIALVPLGVALVLRAYLEARADAGSSLAALPEVGRRYPVIAALVLLSFVTAGISLAHFEDGERWVRTTANLSTVAIVFALVVHYLRTAGRELQTATRRNRNSSG